MMQRLLVFVSIVRHAESHDLHVALREKKKSGVGRGGSQREEEGIVRGPSFLETFSIIRG